MKPAVCVGVHAVFAPGALESLSTAGAARVVTTNTIAHETNAIDVTSALSEAVGGLDHLGPGRATISTLGDGF